MYGHPMDMLFRLQQAQSQSRGYHLFVTPHNVYMLSLRIFTRMGPSFHPLNAVRGAERGVGVVSGSYLSMLCTTADCCGKVWNKYMYRCIWDVLCPILDGGCISNAVPDGSEFLKAANHIGTLEYPLQDNLIIIHLLPGVARSPWTTQTRSVKWIPDFQIAPDGRCGDLVVMVGGWKVDADEGDTSRGVHRTRIRVNLPRNLKRAPLRRCTGRMVPKKPVSGYGQNLRELPTGRIRTRIDGPTQGDGRVIEADDFATRPFRRARMGPGSIRAILETIKMECKLNASPQIHHGNTELFSESRTVHGIGHSDSGDNNSGVCLKKYNGARATAILETITVECKLNVSPQIHHGNTELFKESKTVHGIGHSDSEDNNSGVQAQRVAADPSWGYRYA
ncbi:hypothetical protein FIBSPDRAFT_1015534 [Athelia psychrophila]|uniref:Uncharacterized protein n=1 Tax=Athelia psychrophila TaxID=1759441 RepID=A0A166LM06_9AGAM|nr:hypothetical protein FIBSPDRAFT_1015534 [Fibularhizoctonia sp. CBS 109695]